MTAKSSFSKIFTFTTIIILAIILCIPMAEEVHAAPKKVKVTFNVNGGKSLPKAKRSKSIVVGKKVGTLPKATRKGYTFKGWYTKKSGGKKISKNTQIKKKTTCYARWTAKSYTIKFDANGGTTPTIKSKKVKYNSRYGALPTTSRTGHDFKGWYTAKTGGKEIKDNDINSVASNSTLYARWQKTLPGIHTLYLINARVTNSSRPALESGPFSSVNGLGWYYKYPSGTMLTIIFSPETSGKYKFGYWECYMDFPIEKDAVTWFAEGYSEYENPTKLMTPQKTDASETIYLPAYSTIVD